jgi:hypothetical protein
MGIKQNPQNPRTYLGPFYCGLKKGCTALPAYGRKQINFGTLEQSKLACKTCLDVFDSDDCFKQHEHTCRGAERCTTDTDLILTVLDHHNQASAAQSQNDATPRHPSSTLTNTRSATEN